MQADSNPLLSQLSDIRPAAEPAWWPPAAGWWVLLGLLLLLLAWLGRDLARRAAIRRRKRRWLQALERMAAEHDPHSMPHDYLAGLNRLFRAVALRAFPGTGCARLQGREWVAFLSGLMPESTTGQVPADALSALASGPYEPAPEFDAVALEQLARAWVAHYG